MTTKKMSLQISLKFKQSQELSQKPPKKLRLLSSMSNQISKMIFKSKVKSKRLKSMTSFLSLMTMNKRLYSLKTNTKNKKISLKIMFTNTKSTMMTTYMRKKIWGKIISQKNFMIIIILSLKKMKISFQFKNKFKSMHYHHQMIIRKLFKKLKI